MRGHRLFVVAWILTGCAPGSIEWATGGDLLRTALYHDPTPDEGLSGTLLFLSTGRFDCDLPTFDDPQTQSEALAAIQVGACREDARHLVFELHQSVTAPPRGSYALSGFDGGAWPEGLDPVSNPRVATARYVGIEEARAELTEGLVPSYVPTDVDQYVAAFGDEGELRVLRSGERLRGRFDLSVPHVSGAFLAEPCSLDGVLFHLLAAAPISSCELAAE